jgi:hypothetical protein
MKSEPVAGILESVISDSAARMGLLCAKLQRTKQQRLPGGIDTSATKNDSTQASFQLARLYRSRDR